MRRCNCDSFYGLTATRGKGHCTGPPSALKQLYKKFSHLSPPVSAAPAPARSAASYLPSQSLACENGAYDIASPPISHGVFVPVSLAGTVPFAALTQAPLDYSIAVLPSLPDNNPPIYVRNEDGLSINVSNGAVLSQSCGIHIANLPFSVTRSELVSLLNMAGKPTSYELNASSSGRSRGSAVAFFSDPKEAKDAINILNNYRHKGKALRVRPTREPAPGPPCRSPAIVNGSTGYQVRKLHS